MCRPPPGDASPWLGPLTVARICIRIFVAGLSFLWPACRTVSGAEALAALRTTTVDHSAARTGAHTLTEAVLHVATAVVRLESPLHSERSYKTQTIWCRLTTTYRGYPSCQTKRQERDAIGYLADNKRDDIGNWAKAIRPSARRLDTQSSSASRRSVYSTDARSVSTAPMNTPSCSDVTDSAMSAAG